MLGKILDTASLLKAKIKKDEMEEALLEATNQDNWQASTDTLHKIASGAYSRQKWNRIREFLWEKLKNQKNWKKMLKALNIVEFLLKNGPMFAAKDLGYDLTFFKTLTSFSFYEGSTDRGGSIRERAKVIVELLENEQMLEDQRVRAKQIRERMSHMTSAYSSEGGHKMGNTHKYESYNSKTFAEAKDNSGYYNYGAGNYGDRVEDKTHPSDYFQNMNRYNNEPPTRENATTKEEPVKPQPQVQEEKPKQVVREQPSPKKPSFNSITQSIMKSRTTGQETKPSKPYVPDMSYKHKENVGGEMLIDTEANYVESKYHVAHQQPQPQTKPTPPQPVSQPVQPVYTEAKPVAPVITVAQTPVVSSGLDGINFLGTPEPRPVSEPPKQNQPAPHPQPQPPSAPQPPPQQVPPQPAPQQPSFDQLAAKPTAINNYVNNYGNYVNYSHPNHPSHNAAPGYYNNPYPVPNYHNPYQQPQPTYPYGGPPMGNYGYDPQPYQAPPAPAPAQYPVSRPYSSYNPSTSITLDVSPSKEQPKAVEKEEEFESFKNGDTQKITWMNNKEKNLTDLSDFTLDAQDLKKAKQSVKKEQPINNNIKIDPWAW